LLWLTKPDCAVLVPYRGSGRFDAHQLLELTPVTTAISEGS